MILNHELDKKLGTFSNNIVMNKVEANNLRNIGFNNVAIYVFVGASLAADYSGCHALAANNIVVIENSRGGSLGYPAVNPSLDLLTIENKNKLMNMKKFDFDWNGNGGKAFSKKSIDLFNKIIDFVCKQPQIAPTGNESLLMQYEKNDGSLLAFDVSIRKTSMVLIPKGNFDLAKEETFSAGDIGCINAAVSNFYGLT